MSDSEDNTKLKTNSNDSNWYGSLENQIKPTDNDFEDSKSPIPSDNIHTSNEYMELDEPEILDEKKKMLEEFERKRRARMITVPTDDHEVSTFSISCTKRTNQLNFETCKDHKKCSRYILIY